MKVDINNCLLKLYPGSDLSYSGSQGIQNDLAQFGINLNTFTDWSEDDRSRNMATIDLVSSWLKDSFRLTDGKNRLRTAKKLVDKLGRDLKSLLRTTTAATGTSANPSLSSVASRIRRRRR